MVQYLSKGDRSQSRTSIRNPTHGMEARKQARADSGAPTIDTRHLSVAALLRINDEVVKRHYGAEILGDMRRKDPRHFPYEPNAARR